MVQMNVCMQTNGLGVATCFRIRLLFCYLIIRDKVDELLEDYEKLREYQNDYVQMQKSPDVYELDEVMATQKEIEVLSAYIKEIYESYLKSLDDELPEGSLEEVISNVQVWNDKRLKLLKGEYEI